MLRFRTKLVLVATIAFVVQFVKADDLASNQVTQSNEMAKLLERIDQLANRLEVLEQRLGQKQTETSNLPNTLSEPQNLPNQISQFPNMYRPGYYIAPSTNDPVPQHPYSNPTTTYQYPPHLYSPRRPELEGYDVPYHNLNQPKQRNRPKAIPKSWKPFNFNGMEYYIIPLREAERLNRHNHNAESNDYGQGSYGVAPLNLVNPRDEVQYYNVPNSAEANTGR